MVSMASSNPITCPSDLNAASDNYASTIPRRGLSHLVSKFETLDKGPAANRGSAHKPPGLPRQPPRLPASQTTSSLGSFPDSWPSSGKQNRNNLENIASHISSFPMHAGSTALTAAKRSTSKLDAPKPKMANGKSCRALTVAEKRKLFETETAQAKRTSGRQHHLSLTLHCAQLRSYPRQCNSWCRFAQPGFPIERDSIRIDREIESTTDYVSILRISLFNTEKKYVHMPSRQSGTDTVTI